MTIAITQTSRETRKNAVRVCLREARAEAAGRSGQCYPDPAVFATSQTPTLPASCCQPLCSAEGSGPVAGELQHSSAAALAAEEVVDALEPTALRAEALLGGTGDKGPCSQGGICVGGSNTELSEFSLPHHFWFDFPLIP